MSYLAIMQFSIFSKNFQFFQAIASHPWLFITVSVALTAFCTVQIPLTPMTNDVADFTPTGARARRELEVGQKICSGQKNAKIRFPKLGKSVKNCYSFRNEKAKFLFSEVKIWPENRSFF